MIQLFTIPLLIIAISISLRIILLKGDYLDKITSLMVFICCIWFLRIQVYYGLSVWFNPHRMLEIWNTQDVLTSTTLLITSLYLRQKHA